MLEESRAKPGQSVSGTLKAETWNTLVELARRDRLRRLGDQSGPVGSALVPSLEALVRNDTGSNVSQGYCLRITGALLDPAGAALDFLARPVFSGAVPSATPLPTDAICILLEPCGPSELAHAVLLGVAQCQLSVSDTTHLFALATASDATLLTSAAAGPARILWKETGSTGNQAAVVLLEGGQSAGWGGIRAVSTNRSVTAADDLYLLDVDATAAAVTITLPSSPGLLRNGFLFWVRKKDAAGINTLSSHPVTVTGVSIEGGSTWTLDLQYEVWGFLWTGAAWTVLDTNTRPLLARNLNYPVAPATRPAYGCRQIDFDYAAGLSVAVTALADYSTVIVSGVGATATQMGMVTVGFQTWTGGKAVVGDVSATSGFGSSGAVPGAPGDTWTLGLNNTALSLSGSPDSEGAMLSASRLRSATTYTEYLVLDPYQNQLILSGRVTLFGDPNTPDGAPAFSIYTGPGFGVVRGRAFTDPWGNRFYGGMLGEDGAGPATYGVLVGGGAVTGTVAPAAASVALGTSGDVLTSNGVGVAPSFQPPVSGAITAGTTPVSGGVTGGVLVDNGGAVTEISPGTTGLPLLSGGSGSIPVYGPIDVGALATDSVTTPKIQDGAVTLAKLDPAAKQYLTKKGRYL